MAPDTPSKNETKIGMYDHELQFLNWVFQSFETEPKIDYEKLQGFSGLSKSAVQAKWWRLRQKYMPQIMTPKKRKAVGEDGDAEGEGESKKKAGAKPKTPRKTKAQKIKEEEEIKKEQDCEEQDDEGEVGGPEEV